jgi:hypothetical protein
MFDWNAIGQSLLADLKAIYRAIGLGGGAGVLQLLRFMPAPYTDQIWRGAFIDAIWTLAGNSRAGERRTRDGAVVPKPKPDEPKDAGDTGGDSTPR